MLGILRKRTSGDELERLVREQTDNMFRFAFFRTGDRSTAEDIVQDTLLIVCRQNNRPTEPEKLKSYVFRALSNRCRDVIRKHRTDTEPLTCHMAEKAAEDNDNERSAMEEYARIERVLGEIPDEQAETIRMHVIDELKFTEIADITETPVTTVKSRFKYGIEKIKERMNNRKNN